MKKNKYFIKLSFCKNYLIHHAIKLFLLTFFFCGCSRPCYHQQKALTGFFEELLLEHGGAFTLFGTKPITVEDLYDASDGATDKIVQYLAQHPEIEVIYVDRNLDEGWREFNKLYSQVFFENYVLTEIECDGSRLLVFVNVSEAIAVLNKYQKYFTSIIGREFNSEELIQDLREKKCDDWKKIISNSKALGILAGYGYLNSHLFSEIRNFGHNFLPSESNDPRNDAECVLNKRPFRIPIFVMLDEKESSFLVSEYKKQRKDIMEIYKEQDFLKTTLHELQKKRLKN